MAELKIEFQNDADKLQELSAMCYRAADALALGAAAQGAGATSVHLAEANVGKKHTVTAEFDTHEAALKFFDALNVARPPRA